MVIAKRSWVARFSPGCDRTRRRAPRHTLQLPSSPPGRSTRRLQVEKVADVPRADGKALATSWRLDRTTSPLDVLRVGGLQALAAGHHRFGGALLLRGRWLPEEVAPPGYVVSHRWRIPNQEVVLGHVREPDLVLFFDFDPDQMVVRVTGRDERSVVEELERLESLQAAKPVEPSAPEMRFWQDSSDGANYRTRPIAGPSWAEIQANYPVATRTLLGELMACRRPTAPGQLILWRGVPGTGKTSAIRALARAWADWCTIHVVVDGDRFFESPAYLNDVLFYADRSISRDESQEQRWNLVVVEDADDYLRAGGGRRSGGALGRLLNATDGLLGQTADALILLTTNQELGRLDPAITRPGRCLAAIEFVPFDSQEARRWLGVEDREVTRAMTLAELFEHRQLSQIAAPEQTLPIGAYL